MKKVFDFKYSIMMDVEYIFYSTLNNPLDENFIEGVANYYHEDEVYLRNNFEHLPEEYRDILKKWALEDYYYKNDIEESDRCDDELMVIFDDELPADFVKCVNDRIDEIEKECESLQKVNIQVGF